MDQPGIILVKQIRGVAKAMRTALKAAAIAYAHGGGRGKPIVDRNFTAGNGERHGWPPLSRGYFLAKAAGITRKGKNSYTFLDKTERTMLEPHHQKELARKRGSSVLDKNVKFQSSTGTMVGIGSGTNLPMLVLTGRLRKEVTSGAAIIREENNGSRVVIAFPVPDYGRFLHEGTAKMPKRSPIEPSPDMVEEVVNVARRHMDKSMGTGGAVPVSSDTVPGKARMA